MEFILTSEYIALCDCLKTNGLAESGGRAKMIISDGLVKVDGAVELRRTAKIRPGQTIEYMGEVINVIA